MTLKIKLKWLPINEGWIINNLLQPKTATTQHDLLINRLIFIQMKWNVKWIKLKSIDTPTFHITIPNQTCFNANHYIAAPYIYFTFIVEKIYCFTLHFSTKLFSYYQISTHLLHVYLLHTNFLSFKFILPNSNHLLILTKNSFNYSTYKYLSNPFYSIQII